MATVPRYYDDIVKVVSDQGRKLDDLTSTVLARIGKSVPVVLATSEILTPYAGQLIVNATDNMIYEYNGTAWVGVAAMGGSSATQRHEARYEHKVTMNFTTSTDTKIKFDTAVTTCDDVVASGTGNTDFALNRAGLWLITAGLRYNGNAGAGERHIFMQTGTVFNTANRFGSMAVANVGSVPVTVTCSSAIRVTSGTSICVAGWQNCGATLGTDVGFGGTDHVSMTWLRP
jgi:hypothetical protein